MGSQAVPHKPIANVPNPPFKSVVNPPANGGISETKKLKEEIEKKGFYLLIISGLVKGVAEKYMKEVKQTLEEVDKFEGVIEVNEKDVEEKKKIFKNTSELVTKSKENYDKMNEGIKNFAEETNQVELSEQTLFKFVKGKTNLHDKWIKLECKRDAIEECVIHIKKSYEDKSIPLDIFLESTRKLYAKSFMTLYKKKAIETKFKSM